MKKIIVLCLLIFCFKTGYPQESLEFLTDSAFIHASVSALVQNVKTGEIIFELNSVKNLAPASIQKLITSAAALELLGPDYRFSTTLGYTGIIDNSGVLNGDIVIQGGGDPTLGSVEFPEFYNGFLDKWLSEIKKTGIKEIKGRVITDDSYYDYNPVPPKWLWEDAGNYYGAGVYGLSLYDNVYEIHLKTSDSNSKPVITGIYPSESRIQLSNQLIASGSSDYGFVFSAPYSNSGWLSGTVPVNSEDFVLKASITDPPLLMARIINRKLKEAGIKVTNEPTTVRISQQKPEPVFPLITTFSPPLRNILKVMNHKSINLYAEHLVKELGKKFLNEGSTAAGLKVIGNFLDKAGITQNYICLEDGSGLSHLNSFCAQDLTALLVYMEEKGRNFSDYLGTIAAAGEGTLKYNFRDPVFSSKLRAKSGSMTRARSYAGYLKTNQGNDMAFCIMVNNFSGPASHVVHVIETTLKAIILAK
jgi:D-alanyl-D-alanine carboxypeptidase/D-alanyl-D-alanine-endopeptidase (penicillin-binding protein 4)